MFVELLITQRLPVDILHAHLQSIQEFYLLYTRS